MHDDGDGPRQGKHDWDDFVLVNRAAQREGGRGASQPASTSAREEEEQPQEKEKPGEDEEQPQEEEKPREWGRGASQPAPQVHERRRNSPRWRMRSRTPKRIKNE